VGKVRQRPFRQVSTGNVATDRVLDAMSRAHISLVQHVTGTKACVQETVFHGLGVTPTGAWLVKHDSDDAFRMYVDYNEANSESVPCRFTDTGVTVWIAFRA